MTKSGGGFRRTPTPRTLAIAAALAFAASSPRLVLCGEPTTNDIGDYDFGAVISKYGDAASSSSPGRFLGTNGGDGFISLASSASSGSVEQPQPELEGGASCASHSTCTECASSSWGCHWCESDGGACHAKGSRFGCRVGAECHDDDDGGKGKNGTDPDGGGGDNKKNGTDDNHCASHLDCEECASSSWGCHWCAHDEACHAIGSRFGCLRGEACDVKPDDNGGGGKNGTDPDDGKKNGTDPDSGGGGGGGDKKNDTDSCASHLTCEECASSSWECHWCGHDHACHAKGSRFGCLRGESCDAPPPTTPPAPTPTPVPPPPPPPQPNETGCASHSTCEECDASSWNCHWCAHDEACHAVGSIHGCLRGETCGDKPKPAPDKKKNDTSCAAHTSCSSCALSSWGCHWCAHDDACHAIGSVHGCVSGVNCYSNDRCTRTHPEPIERNVFGQIGLVPALAVVAAGMMVLACATACTCVVGCASGTYDDLEALAEGRRTGANEGEQRRRGYQPPEIEVADQTDVDTSEEVALLPPSTDDGEDGECHGEDGDNEMGLEMEVEVEDEEEEEEQGECVDEDDEEGPLLGGDGPSGAEDEADARTPFLFWRSRGRSRSQPRLRPRPQAPPSSAKRFYTGCKICYAVTVCSVAAAVAGALICFPKAPDYNVCNNQVTWKSIVDGMKSGKLQTSFQLLMSVENPNHVEVDVEMGSGTFKHDGVEVGTFDIPPTTVAAMSISDVLVSITFTPDKWQALALSTEYYKGTLKFGVDATATVVMPALGGYTFSGGIENYVVHANDPKLQDRHLCACPEWGDEKKKKKDGPKGTEAEFAELMGISVN